ncbi:MAG TPA: ShlB/FhaC/HecB family hemolysin secretion/activation protein, partial [Candidatus Elarobacter sp.]|nr:ShlB/FhaC/HecB family hemolysin secretion/activation protein [Candidatus Elarobacter sp.]
LAQDSTLRGYDATTYERMSVGMKVSSLGRDRLLMRTERATHVQWERGKGAVVDVTGQRSALPMFEGMGETDVNIGTGSVPIPYFPGRETLWIGSSVARANIDATAMVHPIANGAEAYYTYASGDSVSFQLPGGRRIVVRELRVQPRATRWNVVLGSLWFDTETGQLVRGVFRMSEPLDALQVAKESDGEDVKKEIPAWLRPMILPMTGAVDVITVDYGLYEGRYWLPRMQTVEGKARAGIMRFPFELRQRYDYESVNGSMALPPMQIATADTARGRVAREHRREANDSACAAGATYRESHVMRDSSRLAILVRTPCDTASLARSATLPRSIYDTPDSLFAQADMDALVASALSLGRQGGLSRGPTTVTYGIPLTRYNRIEGISTGVQVDQQLGGGFGTHALARLGVDLSPNGELGLSRTNGRETYTATVYRRLNSANDWRNPFGLSASLSALLFGHDDNVYYRSWGAELTHGAESGLLTSWRLFAEQEFDASVHSTFSFAGKLKGGRFPDNIDAVNGSIVGLSVRKLGSLGENPDGWRLTSDLRAEGAAGTFDFTRGMADVTVSHPITGSLAGSLTMMGGTSGGALPVQRYWYLGGTSTVRGQPVGVAVGNAFWLTRTELGLGSVAARPVIFTDIGWAGDRHMWRDRVVPVSGAGVGASFLDGLIRMDLAKGIRPTAGVQASLYLDARF